MFDLPPHRVDRQVGAVGWVERTMGTGRRRLGVVGEQLAARWYEQHGFTVVERNWRCRHGELDLICRQDGLIVFSEVKSRSSLAFGHPLEAVTRTKQLRIRRLAALWLAGYPGHVEDLRFDVVSVLAGHVEVVPFAF